MREFIFVPVLNGAVHAAFDELPVVIFKAEHLVQWDVDYCFCKIRVRKRLDTVGRQVNFCD